MEHLSQDIIVAPATPPGGALSVVRLSGCGSIELTQKIFRSSKGDNTLLQSRGYTLHYGTIVDSQGRVIDDVMLSLFRTPHSYTSEDSVEISCHGSRYIVQEIINLAIKHGARIAEHGEFTQRAYLAGRMDLSQAEAVADMIASTSEAAHTMASTQMRGGYSQRLAELRGELLKLMTLLELELDFSEEDVEFASRETLRQTIASLQSEVEQLAESFELGNAIKHGVNVAIVGEPNVGKSTLLNRLLNDDRAMVSDIAGTTRDLIEEVINIKGIDFRFVDTAGLHTTSDTLEQMGIKRTHQAISRADIVIHLIDARCDECHSIETSPKQHTITVRNKVDLGCSKSDDFEGVSISAREDIGIDILLTKLHDTIDTGSLYAGSPIVSNARHYEHLQKALSYLGDAQAALSNGTPTDLLCEDLRQVLYHIGSITGEITHNEILHNIFSNFCIGK
ncbi:MAG: tRNA uridine-5-carboxymethylaminomethyl(34) synthesis GTPase MnmE [Rikenellaceae bacterium]